MSMCLVCLEDRRCDITGTNWVYGGESGEVGVCAPCLADAKLGRMVRSMPRDQHLAHRETTWASWRDDFGYDRNFHSGTLPEEALEKAMGEEK